MADLQYITLNDFSPGMFADWYSLGGANPAPDGAAQVTGTFGCVASQSGGLIPAPRKVDHIDQTLIEADGTNKYPPNDAQMHILAFRCAPVSIYNNQVPTNLPRRHVAPVIAYQWFYNPAPDGINWFHRARTRLFKPFANTTSFTPSTYDILTIAGAAAFNPEIISGMPLYGAAGIDMTRSNTAAPTLGGYPVVVATQATTETRSALVAYPSNATPSTDSTANITLTSGFSAAAIFGHQNRTFILTYFGSYVAYNDFGSTTTQLDPTDIMDYTAVNDYSTGSGLTAGIVFSPEKPSGYGSWVSMNVSELFLVKVTGGGVTIRGDISNPTILHLPGVAPTYLDKNIGTMTPQGYVYGSSNGIWLWTGGDVSTLLSPQFANFRLSNANNYDGISFWRTQLTANHAGATGSFAYLEPYIFAPSNYMYDTRLKSWWRLSDPSGILYNWYDVSPNGGLCAAPAVVSASQTETMAWFDLTVGQSSYSWTSQPLQKSLNRELDFREVDIVTQGAGTVTVTLTGLNGIASTPVTFNVSTSAYPYTQSLPIACKAHDVVLKITANSGNSSVAAPRVYRVALGYHERETAR